MAGQLQSLILGYTLAGWATVWIGIVTAELLERFGFRTEVLVVNPPPVSPETNCSTLCDHIQRATLRIVVGFRLTRRVRRQIPAPLLLTHCEINLITALSVGKPVVIRGMRFRLDFPKVRRVNTYLIGSISRVYRIDKTNKFINSLLLGIW